MRRAILLGLVLVTMLGQAAALAQPSLQSGTVSEAAQRMKAGEFLWAPAVAPEGPMLFVISLATQRAILYRNGIPIAITTVSTGRPGHRTPTGVFTVLQRAAVHYSSIYNSAPMPHMQRLTRYGVALHGGDLPGYPASHGCIRLPREFARLMFGVTRLGMTVVITSEAAIPHVAPAELLLRNGPRPLSPGEAIAWQPQRAPSGPVVLVVSVTDRQLAVIRNGIVIGSTPVSIDGSITHTSAYVVSNASGAQSSWRPIELPGQEPGAASAPWLGRRIHMADSFRHQLETILRPGDTVVVTNDTLGGGVTAAR